MTTLEMRYRRLLRAYPRAYREAHAEEILGTLMEASGGRERPPLRETAGLIGGGLTARVRGGAEHPVSWWADGMHLGILLIALTHLIADLSYVYPGSLDYLGWVVGSAVLVVALLRGWIRVALPLALGGMFGIGRGLLFRGPLGPVVPSFGPVYGDWGSAASYGLIAAGLIALAVRRSRGTRVRSWWWLALAVAGWIALNLDIPVGSYYVTKCGAALASCHLIQIPAYHTLWGYARPMLECALMLAGIWATRVTRDARWLLAGVLYLLARAAPVLAELPRILLRIDSSPTVLFATYWTVLALLLLAMGGTAYRARRIRA